MSGTRLDLHGLQRYELTKHGLRRFVERVRPDLRLASARGMAAAQLEMLAWMAGGVERREWPEWCSDRRPKLHLDVGGDACVVLSQRGRDRWAAVTVLVRGGVAH